MEKKYFGFYFLFSKCLSVFNVLIILLLTTFLVFQNFLLLQLMFVGREESTSYNKSLAFVGKFQFKNDKLKHKLAKYL